MMAFDLLSEPIRKYIRDKHWEQLRPIQAAAISKILTTEDNYILASRTASGKTEAAFLPILSKLDFKNTGVEVLYISPLIALINDQFYRVEELCKYLDVAVTKWHGEASKTLKNRIIKQPTGIILITPESIEAMFVNKPYNVSHLFSNLKYVVIDEIHSFIGTDRGIQLKSLLSRLQSVNRKSFNIVGLSATIGDYTEAKRFTGNESKTKVLLDKAKNEMEVVFRYFESENGLSLKLLKDLYLQTKDNKVLIFPNSRGLAEVVAVKLKRISKLVNGHPNYFSHHSSLDKEVREYVEYFAKNNRRENFCISCTSTLELGIDIGSVDEIVQIDATHSISSLIQRVGRSGRKEGEISKLFLYATDKWSLLQSLACWLLYNEGFIEPPQLNEKPYDILLHQVLSITKGHSGILISQLVKQLKENFAFNKIEVSEIEDIISHLIGFDLLEKVHDEVIIGLEGEKIVNNRKFYAVFPDVECFKVLHEGRKIGEIIPTSQVQEEQNIFLAAKIWSITFIDFKAKKIWVIPAYDGKKPLFPGTIPAIIHPRIREKMLEILFSSSKYDFLDEQSNEEVEELRKDFSVFNIHNLQTSRPLLTNELKQVFYSFTGTQINNTIGLLFDIAGIEHSYDEYCSSFEVVVAKQELFEKWDSLTRPLVAIDNYIADELKSKPSLLAFSKWGQYLPLKYQINLIREKVFDIKNTEQFLSTIKPIANL